MKTKNNVFVKIANKKEAKNAKRILQALGEEVYSGYWIDDLGAEQDHLIFRKYQNWVLVEDISDDGEKQQVTLKELIQIIAGEQEEVKELKVGKWYKHKTQKHLWFLKKICIGEYKNPHVAYGIDGAGNWSSSDNRCLYGDDFRLATNEEVLEALSKEAVKRGFKEGVKVTHVNKGNVGNFNVSEPFKLDSKNYTFTSGMLFKNNICLFIDGKWAEIIEEPKSILDGTVAVSFSNQKQLEAICKYNKIEPSCSFKTISKNYSYQSYMPLRPYWDHCDKKYYEKLDFNCISFEEFAKEAGIEVPKFIIRSEDGVDMYEKENGSWVIFECASRKWGYTYNLSLVTDHIDLLKNNNTYRVFASKEKAIEWCEKADLPKEKFYAIMRGAGNKIYPTEIFDTEKELNEAIDKISKRDNSKLIESKSILITN